MLIPSFLYPSKDLSCYSRTHTLMGLTKSSCVAVRTLTDHTLTLIISLLYEHILNKSKLLYTICQTLFLM